MKIEQDDFVENKKSNNKTTKTVTIIAILISITILALIGIIFAMLSLQGDELSVVIDGKTVNVEEDTFIFTEDGKIYVSIRDIAPYVGYEAHNGEYKVNVEDTNKIYVEAINGTETTSFYLNSTTISKVAPDSTNDYDNIKIKEPVTMINNKLYVIAEGFIVGFNSTLNYNQAENLLTIQTLPTLVTYYADQIKNFGYGTLSEDFNNQKAIIYGMVVASKETTGKFGVISTSGTEIISPRYNKIEFIENNGEFIITNSSEKVGIAYSTGETKITVSYDEIKVIDSALELYLVKSNNKYGVINSNESLIIHIEYDQIGIDASNFPADNVKNQYILYDTLIPVKLNEKWGLFDIKGNKVTEVEYDRVGSTNEKITNKVVNNSLLIGDSGVVVLCKDEQYGGIDIKGNLLIPVRFDNIYSITSSGQTTYYILYNGTEYNAIEYIDAMKKTLGYEDEEEDIAVPNESTSENGVENTVQTSTNVVDTNSTANTNEINVQTTNNINVQNNVISSSVNVIE